MNINGKDREDLDDAEMVHPKGIIDVNKSDGNVKHMEDNVEHVQDLSSQ
jgi:hypothetical protein